MVRLIEFQLCASIFTVVNLNYHFQITQFV
jgi:hypothetical protein